MKETESAVPPQVQSTSTYESVVPSTPSLECIERSLDEHHVRFVRIVWCDNGNVLRSKAFHINGLRQRFHHGISLSQGQQGVPVMVDAVAENSGLGPVGEAWLVPDWSTLTLLPYAPGHARVLGDMQVGGEAWALCPRAFLRRMVARAAEVGLSIQAAFEPEFYLLQTEQGVRGSADNTPFASSLSMDLNCRVVDDIAEALLQQDLPVECYYPESGPGQHEISIRYSHALQAADRHVVFRETVRGVALQHGLRVSFLPKIFQHHAGSGCHLHTSLWRDGENLTPGIGGEVSAIARHWIGGILHHLPALMALTAPSVNSYRRLQPNLWSGAYRCWGYDNREAAVRVPTNPTPPSPTHLELKTVDGSANPYLALGTVIAAGLDGVLLQREPGEAIAVNPSSMGDPDRHRLGIDRLPQTLGEAIAQFNQNALLHDALGLPLATAFGAVRAAEWAALHEYSIEQEVDLLLERYS